MNELDVSFELPVWEKTVAGLPQGASLSAVRFLTVMEPEPEEVWEEAVDLLQEKQILLDISDLPQEVYVGEAAARLRHEKQLAAEGKIPGGLEENDPLRLYLEEIASVPACGDVQLLARKLLEGDENAAQSLVNLMLHRVVEQALTLTGKGVLLLDLIQDGGLGLWQAILNYAGGDIEAFCDGAICRTMAITVALQARANGVGQKMRQALEDYRSVDEKLLMDLGRNPTIAEIALEMHITEEEATAVREMMTSARSLERAKGVPEPEEEDPDEQQAVEDTAYFQSRQRINEMLSGLNALEAQLLSMRFGLDGGLPMTPEDVGRKLGLTPAEVVEKEAAALEKLRRES